MLYENLRKASNIALSFLFRSKIIKCLALFVSLDRVEWAKKLLTALHISRGVFWVPGTLNKVSVSPCTIKYFWADKNSLRSFKYFLKTERNKQKELSSMPDNFKGTVFGGLPSDPHYTDDNENCERNLKKAPQPGSDLSLSQTSSRFVQASEKGPINFCIHESIFEKKIPGF